MVLTLAVVSVIVTVLSHGQVGGWNKRKDSNDVRVITILTIILNRKPAWRPKSILHLNTDKYSKMFKSSKFRHKIKKNVLKHSKKWFDNVITMMYSQSEFSWDKKINRRSTQSRFTWRLICNVLGRLIPSSPTHLQPQCWRLTVCYCIIFRVTML